MRKSTVIADLVSEEVRRLVADAVRDGSVISASDAATAIMETYPNCGLHKRNVADQVMMAAASAGVAVALGDRPTLGVSA